MRAAFGVAAAAAASPRSPTFRDARAAGRPKRSAPKGRTHGGPEFAFEGSDPCAVEYLVHAGVRPAARAAQRLLDAQRWRAQQQSGEPSDTLLGFAQCRDVVKLLLDAGVGKKLLPRALAAFPGVLALPAAELDARLDALDALGLDTPALLGRALERAPALAALSADDCAATAAALAALGVADVAAFAAAAPEVLCEPPAALAARGAELEQLTGVRPPALGALAARHPALLAPPLGGTLADRVAFWRAAGVADVAALAHAAPAALTASVARNLAPKAAFAQEALGLTAAQAAQRCPALFGSVNLERTLRPRWTFLHALGVATDAAVHVLADWACAADPQAFVAVAATLAPPDVAAERVSLEAFRAHAGAAAADAADDEDA